ncbi:S41 family peptidase [Parendozoicomonas haliclonae]|uniref:Peptidase family S41 n=1 Tax=Parendozoicomonas haliclonae TaxID=1960125 RepID=A0A1X7AI81_9GAMM|nr:S41 family peptidase [Parendozoicomonas haliclonae]SMA44301.1 Peptidase family S41 [Parendozoicomonas haliclonae]
MKSVLQQTTLLCAAATLAGCVSVKDAPETDNLPVSPNSDINYQAEFSWLKKTFEENDAGFSYALSNKGEVAYQLHNQATQEQLETVDDPDAFRQLVREWLAFFRKGHHGIEYLGEVDKQPTVEPSESELKERFKDWPRLDVDLEEFKAYLEDKPHTDYEGIWEAAPYTVGIKQIGEEYVGFIIRSETPYWLPGQIKLRIRKDDSGQYYMRDHSEGAPGRVEIWGNNYLQVSNFSLQRSFPQLEGDQAIPRFFEYLNNREPSLVRQNDNTLLLRVPSFGSQNRDVINQLIDENREEILKTANLIIDVRSNGGGTDSSYESILPLLYTHPIRVPGIEFYSTELNNQRQLDFIQNPQKYGIKPSEVEEHRERYEILISRVGEFVNVFDDSVWIREFDQVHAFPKNISILIDEYSGSTTEQFLLAAKQSQKVKLFGRSTYGVLDISNMYSVDSPSGLFRLHYSLSRSLRIPHMAIDGVGIQPDYYLDKSIPDYLWIEHVAEVMNH